MKYPNIRVFLFALALGIGIVRILTFADFFRKEPFVDLPSATSDEILFVFGEEGRFIYGGVYGHGCGMCLSTKDTNSGHVLNFEVTNRTNEKFFFLRASFNDPSITSDVPYYLECKRPHHKRVMPIPVEFEIIRDVRKLYPGGTFRFQVKRRPELGNCALYIPFADEASGVDEMVNTSPFEVDSANEFFERSPLIVSERFRN